MAGTMTVPSIDELILKTKVAEILNRWPAAGLAVGVVRNAGLEWFHGHGVADIGSNAPVTEDTVFRVASISKTFTAIAVMQLWEQGLVDLDLRQVVDDSVFSRPADCVIRRPVSPDRRAEGGA